MRMISVLSADIMFAVWLGCICYWTRSMVWTLWLQKLDDRCPNCAVLWLAGGVSKCLEVLVLVWVVSRSWTRCCRCWLQRLCDRCPGLFNSWLIGCVSMWPRVLVPIRAVSRSWTRYCKCYSLVVQEQLLG